LKRLFCNLFTPFVMTYSTSWRRDFDHAAL
jgi:hypothetical protein